MILTSSRGQIWTPIEGQTAAPNYSPAPSSAAWPLPIDLVVSVTAYGGDAREDNNSASLDPKALTMNRSLPVSLRFHSLSIRKRAMVVTCSG